VSAAEDDTDEAPPPRLTRHLYGHQAAETALLAAYRSGRMPNGFLLIGPRGIGKATLAYRLARFIFAHPDPSSAEVAQAETLAVEPNHPAARRIAAQSQSDLLVLERTMSDRGVLRQQIAVDDVRKTVTFFGATAGEGGWRIAIVDAVDELNRAGANALLKVLEEPPTRSLLILIAHSAARVPATLRSRCRSLVLRPLSAADIAAALSTARGGAAGDDAVAAAADAADGSVARALALLDSGALALRRRALEQLEHLPTVNAAALHALGDALAGTDPQRLAAFIDTVNAWLAGRLANGEGELSRLQRLADAWDRINRAARDAETYNLERKPLVFSVFGYLAEATRG
jgi:DNA polymerase-3 subunit delta'